MTSDRVTPVPNSERYDEVLPGGRGTEEHGVLQHGHPDDPIDYSVEGVEVVSEPKVEPPAPQPVYIVSDEKVLRQSRTGRGYAVGVPTSVLGKFPERSSAKIRNLSSLAGDRVWLGTDQFTASPQVGYPLDPGAEITLTNETAVWAVADPVSPTLGSGNPIMLATWQDFRIDVH